MKRIVISFFLLAVLWACNDAPRDNPLDPLSPRYQGMSAISGNVVLLNQNQPIALAQVTSQEEGITVFTDQLGYFRFERLNIGAHTLICSKDGFVPETLQVNLAAGEGRVVRFTLNGAPMTLLQTIVTTKIDQFFPSPQYFVTVEASVTDPNGITDVDSVWFVADTLVYLMEYSPSSKKFETIIYKYDLPSNTIQWLIGKPLSILSKDLQGATGRSVPFYVTRIIENGAVPLFPSLLKTDTTTSTPLLRWTPPGVTFNYTYSLNISRLDGGIPTVVWTYEGLISFYEELQFPGNAGTQTLPSGNYVWSVTVVDEFGNSNRSKESFFVVR